MGGVADVDEDCAADEIPDRMRYFGGEDIHEVAAVVVLVPVGRSDGAVGEAADRVAAAEEVAFIERRIFFQSPMEPIMPIFPPMDQMNILSKME